MNYETLQARILTQLPDLSAELRKAARFLVDHPDDVALVSMRVLAARSAVTPTTFVRLARRLGFEDWAALRRPFENRLRGGSTPFAAKADALVQRGPQAIFVESLKTAAANLAAAGLADDQGDLALEGEQFGAGRALERAAGRGERAGGLEEVARGGRRATPLRGARRVVQVHGDDLAGRVDAVDGHGASSSLRI